MKARDDHRPLLTGRIEGRPAADRPQSGEYRRAVGRPDIGDVRLIEKLVREWRRLDRDRLRRRCLLARNVGGGNAPFLDVEERLARLAFEQKHIAGLRHLRDGVDPFTVANDRDQVGIDRQIMVPQVMTQRLKMPDTLARLRVECDRAVREQIIAAPVAAVEVEGRRSQSGEDKAAIRVDAKPAPGIGAAAILPGIAFPASHARTRRDGARCGTAKPRGQCARRTRGYPPARRCSALHHRKPRR